MPYFTFRCMHSDECQKVHLFSIGSLLCQYCLSISWHPNRMADHVLCCCPGSNGIKQTQTCETPIALALRINRKLTHTHKTLNSEKLSLDQIIIFKVYFCATAANVILNQCKYTLVCFDVHIMYCKKPHYQN